MNRHRHWIVLAIVTSGVLASKSHAQEIVFDPTNFGVNVEQVLQDIEIVARLAEQIRNQLRMLENWRFTRLDELLASMQSIRAPIQQAGALDLAMRYPIQPQAYSQRNANEMRALRQHWFQAERADLIQSQTTQNRIVQGMPITQRRVSEYVQKSNAAPGQTAVLQASNETLATLAGQLQSLQAMDLSETRVQLDDEARGQAEAAFARQRRDWLMRDWSPRPLKTSTAQPPVRYPFAAR